MSQSNKARLDQLLLERGLFESREAARTAIIDGGVIVDGEKVTKPGQAVKTLCEVVVLEKHKKAPYVSRGGLKLARAIEYFEIAVEGRQTIDVGASTGGFTDCLLQKGAAGVYAVDVGYGQLDWKLRQDSRVRVFERTNIRNLDVQTLLSHGGERPNLAVMDCSFISVSKTIPPTIALMTPVKELVILVKPQFEAGRGKVGKGGVVREPSVHRQLLRNTVESVLALGLNVHGLTYSPIKGPSGNIEFLLWLGADLSYPIREDWSELVVETVDASQVALNE